MSVEWFGGRLRELREAKGWTRKELASTAGMSESGIRDLELGSRMPAWDTVLKLAAALGVSCEAFQVAPADREAAGPGRPRKADSAPTAEEPKGKKGKGKGKK